MLLKCPFEARAEQMEAIGTAGAAPRETLWSRNFIVIIATSLLIFTIYYQIMVSVTLMAKDALHASESQAGLAAGIFMIAGIAARLFSGSRIHAIGAKRLLLAGLIAFSAGTAGYFLVDGLPALLAVRVLHGLGFGCATTATATIAAGLVPEKRKGEGISWFAMSITLASAFGPMLGMNLYRSFGFRTILMVCTGLLGVVWASAALLRLEHAAPSTPARKSAVPSTPARKSAASSDPKRLLLEPHALPISIISAFVFFSYSGIIGFLSSYAGVISLEKAGSNFFMVYSFAILLSRPLTGKLFDRKGQKALMLPAFLLFGFGLMILGRADNGFLLLASSIVIGLGYGTYTSIAQTIAVQSAPPERAGLATATYLAVAETGIGFGPWLLGLMLPTIGYRGMYALLGAIVLAAMVAWLLAHRAGGMTPHRVREASVRENKG